MGKKLTKDNIDRNILALELVTLHYMENLFDVPLEVLKDFRTYNEINGVTSGFVKLPVTKEDVGKPVIDYLIEVMPKLAKLSRYHWRTILNMSESRLVQKTELYLKEEKENV